MIDLYCGDCLEVMRTLPDGCVDAVVTDPPYDLISGRHRVGFENCLRWVALKVQLPKLDDPNVHLGESVQFSPVTFDGTGLHSIPRDGIDSRVAVPVCAVDLDRDRMVGKPEVQDEGESSGRVTDRVLSDERRPESFQLLGDHTLDLRRDADLSFCKGACGCGRQLGAGLFGFLVLVPRSSLNDGLRGPDLPGLMGRDGDAIGVDHSATGESRRPPGIVAGSGTEVVAMLTLDPRRRTFHLFPARGTGEPRFRLLPLTPQSVRTCSGACRLSPVTKSRGIGDVGEATSGALPFGKVSVHNAIASFISSIVPKKGFMGKAWDGTGIAFSEDFWREVFRVMKPGAHLLAFGGTRTYHRMVCAIEDAGFDVEDTVCWLHGQGFPKHKSKLKPAHEPIVLATKPGGKKWLNIDECRIATSPDDAKAMARCNTPGSARLNASGGFLNQSKGSGPLDTTAGRWPANVAFSHHPDCNGQCVDGCPVAELDRQSGIVKSGGSAGRRSNGLLKFGGQNTRPSHDTRTIEISGGIEPSIGGASRFFYCSKASKADRDEGNTHATVKSTDLMCWLCRLITPPGGTILDPFLGSGSTLKAAIREGFSGIGIESDPKYFAIAERRIAAERAKTPLFA